MKTPKVEIKTLPLSKLRPAAYNPRKISDAAKKGLAFSLEKFGLVQPIVWNKRTGNVVGGHQRLTVLKEAGAKDVTVTVVDLGLEDEKALNVALNSPEISGEFENAKLSELLEQIKATTPELFQNLRFDDLIKGLNLTPIVSPEDAAKTALPEAKYIVLVACASEKEQLDLIEKLTEAGHECKAMMA